MVRHARQSEVLPSRLERFFLTTRRVLAQLHARSVRSAVMRNILSPPSLSLVVAFLVLAGCHSSSPVAANTAGPPADIGGNASSTRLGATVGLSDRSRKADQLVPSVDMSWSWDAARSTARFGPSPTATAFSIQCDADRDQLFFHRFYAAPDGGRATMSFTGNGHVASLPATTVGVEASQTSSWQAAAPTSELTDPGSCEGVCRERSSQNRGVGLD